REDVAQEAEIAHDYRGRIVYELLQNADDAMAGDPSREDAVWIRLTETDLWFGNSGRPLDEDDARGLGGIGASRKGKAIDRRRAQLEDRLLGLPVTAIVFLKHLERIDVQIDVGGREEQITWDVARERHTASSWSAVPGLTEPGIYRVTVTAADAPQRQFLV